MIKDNAHSPVFKNYGELEIQVSIPSIWAGNYFLYMLFAEQSRFSFPWEAAAWDFHLQTQRGQESLPKPRAIWETLLNATE